MAEITAGFSSEVFRDLVSFHGLVSVISTFPYSAS